MFDKVDPFIYVSCAAGLRRRLSLFNLKWVPKYYKNLFFEEAEEPPDESEDLKLIRDFRALPSDVKLITSKQLEVHVLLAIVISLFFRGTKAISEYTSSRSFVWNTVLWAASMVEMLRLNPDYEIITDFTCIFLSLYLHHMREHIDHSGGWHKLMPEDHVGYQELFMLQQKLLIEIRTIFSAL